MANSKMKGEIFYGVLSILFLICTSFLSFLPILLIGIIKLLPINAVKIACTKSVDKIATVWIELNNTILDKLHPLNWHIAGSASLHPDHWYLVVANHQSWLDIVILQRLFNRKIPVLKFFIKDQLKWVPFLGFAWWAMGCPFMKRYSKSYLEKYPHKKGQDIKITLKAMQLFKLLPTTLMNFVEGTRYDVLKKAAKKSPYQHLLQPKAGGISFALGTLGEKVHSLLDVTILYPQGGLSFWDFLCGRLNQVKIYIQQIEIPKQFTTMAITENDALQSEFRRWLNTQWALKDHLLTNMKA